MAQNEDEQRTEVENKQIQDIGMDPNANIKKPLRARKTMTPSSRKQVEILKNLHGLGKTGSNTYTVDNYVQLRMVETDCLNYDSCEETSPNHVQKEAAKEPVAKLVVNSEISIYNDSGDLSRDLPYKTNSDTKQFLNAGSLQDLLYALYKKESSSPVSKPVEVHLCSEPSDQPLDGSEEPTCTLASPTGNLPALLEAEEKTEPKPGNPAVAVLEQQNDAFQSHEVLPDNTLRKRRPLGCDEDVTFKRRKSDEMAERSRRRKTSECEEVITRKCLESSDEITSGLHKVKSFIQSHIDNVMGDLDHKVQQLNRRVDNTRCPRKHKRRAIRLAEKISKLDRRVNSIVAVQQAQANLPPARAKNIILNAAKAVPGTPGNLSIAPRSLLDEAPSTTALSSAKETSLTMEASGVPAGNSAVLIDVQQKGPSLNAGASADIRHTPKNMMVIDLTEEEDANRDEGKETSVKVNPLPENIGPKPLQPMTESSKESVAKESTGPGNNWSGTSSKACTLPEKISVDNMHIRRPGHQISSPNVPASFSHLPPLPRIQLFPERSNGFNNTLPPQKLELAVVQVQNPKGIALQWNVSQVDPRCAPIESFHLFICHETTGKGPTPWIKTSEIKALPLPMACSLSQFSTFGKCHFIMQSKDIFGRFGPFCDIQSISAA